MVKSKLVWIPQFATIWTYRGNHNSLTRMLINSRCEIRVNSFLPNSFLVFVYMKKNPYIFIHIYFSECRANLIYMFVVAYFNVYFLTFVSDDVYKMRFYPHAQCKYSVHKQSIVLLPTNMFFRFLSVVVLAIPFNTHFPKIPAGFHTKNTHTKTTQCT